MEATAAWMAAAAGRMHDVDGMRIDAGGEASWAEIRRRAEASTPSPHGEEKDALLAFVVKKVVHTPE